VALLISGGVIQSCEDKNEKDKRDTNRVRVVRSNSIDKLGGEVVSRLYLEIIMLRCKNKKSKDYSIVSGVVVLDKYSISKGGMLNSSLCAKRCAKPLQ